MSASHQSRAIITNPVLPPEQSGRLASVGVVQVSAGDPSCTPAHDLEVTWATTGDITGCLCDVYINENSAGFVLQAANVAASALNWDGLSEEYLYENAGGVNRTWEAKVILKDTYGRKLDSELSDPYSELVKIATCS